MACSYSAACKKTPLRSVLVAQSRMRSGVPLEQQQFRNDARRKPWRGVASRQAWISRVRRRTQVVPLLVLVLIGVLVLVMVLAVAVACGGGGGPILDRPPTPPRCSKYLHSLRRFGATGGLSAAICDLVGERKHAFLQQTRSCASLCAPGATP